MKMWCTFSSALLRLCIVTKLLAVCGVEGAISIPPGPAWQEAVSGIGEGVKRSGKSLRRVHDFDRVHPVLARFLEPKQPLEIQRAAVAAIGSFTQRETAPILIAN